MKEDLNDWRTIGNLVLGWIIIIIGGFIGLFFGKTYNETLGYFLGSFSSVFITLLFWGRKI